MINRDFDLLTEPEMEQANQVVALGYLYRELDNFASKHQIFRAARALYIGAVALGVTEVLQEYVDHVCRVEAEVLKEETSLSYIAQQLQKVRAMVNYVHRRLLLKICAQWFIILPGLERICTHIERRSVYGTQVLDFMTQQSLSGLPVMQQVAQR